MIRLVFDTATSIMYLALLKESEKIAEKIRISQKDHSKHLVAEISLMFKNNNLEIKDLAEIIIGIGPGSYTGSRIAVTVAKTLCYSLKIPLKVVSSLFLLTSGYHEKVFAKIDARNNNFFAAKYNQLVTIKKDFYLEGNKSYQGFKDIIINENNFLVDLTKVVNKAVIVQNIWELEPNYLRKTRIQK